MASTYRPSLAAASLESKPRGEYTTQLAASLLVATARANDQTAIAGPKHPSTQQAIIELRELESDARALFSLRHN